MSVFTDTLSTWKMLVFFIASKKFILSLVEALIFLSHCAALLSFWPNMETAIVEDWLVGGSVAVGVGLGNTVGVGVGVKAGVGVRVGLGVGVGVGLGEGGATHWPF